MGDLRASAGARIVSTRSFYPVQLLRIEDNPRSGSDQSSTVNAPVFTFGHWLRILGAT
jgi:hypothetical protein